MLRVAVISVHGCPNIQAGLKDAGGMNVYVLETARQLASCGVEVDVFTRHHDPLDPQVIHLAPGARLIHLTAGPPSVDKTGVFELLPEFTAQLRSFVAASGDDYDLVSSHYWLSGLVGIELQRIWGVPHVTSYHTLAEVKRRARPGERELPQRSASERRIAETADRIIVWTDHEKDAAINFYGAPANRVAIIPPGVDAARFAPQDKAKARARLGLDPRDSILLYVGRLERLKGLDILLEATRALGRSDRLRLNVIGGNDDSAELGRLKGVVKELGLQDSVRFLGSMSHEELPAYYAAADVCVLPSYYESFGFAALEAAACGRPVVASRVGGLTSVVLDGRTGYLIPWRCPGPFVERLEMLLTNERLRRAMGTAARRHAESMTWAAAADRLVRMFGEVIRGRVPLGETAIAGD